MQLSPANRPYSANPSILLGRSADQGLTLDQALRRMGAEAAGVETEVDPERVAVLEEQARARAAEQQGDNWDAERFRSHRERERVHTAELAREGELAVDRQGALVDLDARALERCDTPEPGPAPRLPWLPLGTTVCLFAASLVPTLDALLNSGAVAGPQRWITPGVVALACGLGLALPGVHAAREPDAPWWERHIFLLGGLVCAAGLAKFRFLLATTAQGEAIGWALVAVELAAATVAHGIAGAHRRDWLRWWPRRDARARAETRVAAARERVERMEAEIDEIRTTRKAFVRDVHDQESQHHAGPRLEASSIAVARDGYYQQIAENRAAALGRAVSGQRQARSAKG